jgi:hypothetical protein
MTIQITTAVQGCHLVVKIISNGHVLLQLTDNDQGSTSLLPGLNYRFEWHVWTATDAHVHIQASVAPANNGFPPLTVDRDYSAGSDDGNLFLFTLI